MSAIGVKVVRCKCRPNKALHPTAPRVRWVIRRHATADNYKERNWVSFLEIPEAAQNFRQQGRRKWDE